MINYYLRLQCLFLDGAFHLDSEGMRESIPRQVDKKSGVPKEKKGVWGSQGGGKDKLFVFSTFLSLSYTNGFFFL